MKSRTLLLSFDVEEFDLPEEYQVPVPEEPRNAISAAGTRRILDVLRTEGVKATFFVTGYFAERNPELLQEMVAGGHEIASHGMNHTVFAPADLAASRELLSRLTGKTVTGFRMARLAPVKKAEIAAAGYVYESSLNPVWLPGRYRNFRKPLLPFREPCGLWQLPVSAVPVVRFPLFWLAFKNLPLWFYKLLCAVTVRWTGYFNMYSHPWEYAEEARDSRWHVPGYVTRHAGRKQAERLGALIRFLKKRGNFLTFQEYLADRRND